MENALKGLIVAAAVLLGVGVVRKVVGSGGDTSRSGRDTSVDPSSSAAVRPSFHKRSSPTSTPSTKGRLSATKAGPTRRERRPALRGTSIVPPSGAGGGGGTAAKASSLRPVDTPEELLALLEEILADTGKGSSAQLKELGEMLARMGVDTFDTAFSVLDRLGDESQKIVFLNGYLYTLAQSDPTAALGFAEQVENKLYMNTTRSTSRRYGQREAMATVFRGWAATDLEGLVAWSEQLPRGSTRSLALQTVLSQWTKQDMAGALDWSRTLAEGQDGTWALHQVASSWAAQDLDAAVAYAQNMPSGQLRDAFLQGIIMKWMGKDAQAAIDSLGLVSSESALRSATYRIVRQWSYTDPAAAAAWVNEGVMDSSARTQHLDTIMRSWARKDLNAALAFADTVADEKTRERLLGTATTELARTDPAKAVQLLQELPDSARRTSLTQTVVERWAQKDPVSAAKWASQFTDGTQKQTAYGDIAMQWGKKDADAAAAWVRTLPAGATRYGSILALAAAQQSFQDYETVSAWRKEITNPELSAERVRELVQQTDMSADQRRSLLSLL